MMLGMRSKIRGAAFSVLMAAALSACSYPEEVRTAADIVVSAVGNLKTQLKGFEKAANKSRVASEERLASWKEAGSEARAAVDAKNEEWRIVKDKTALSLMKELRVNDAAIRKDPFAAIAYRPSGKSGQAKKLFKRLKIDTAALDTVIKNIGKLRKKRKAKDKFKFLRDYGKRVSEELKKLEKAKKEQDKNEKK